MSVSNTKSFTQVAHGFEVGDLIYFNGSWVLAQANSSTTLAEGLVTAKAGDDDFTVYIPGGNFVTILGHGLGSAGSPVYLSEATGGLITTTIPVSGFVQVIGQIIDVDTLAIQSFGAYEV